MKWPSVQVETKDDIFQMPEKDLEFLFSKGINDHSHDWSRWMERKKPLQDLDKRVSKADELVSNLVENNMKEIFRKD